MNRRNKVVALVLLSSLAALLYGCGGGEKFGEEITVDETTRVGDILARPDEFDGKTVKIEGEITRECPTGCWLDVKDETGAAYVDLGPSGFAIPQKVGSKVTVEGKVLKRQERTMIIGKGVEIE